MQWKTLSRIRKLFENKQPYFIDSSIILEIVYKQEYADNCKHFLNSTKSSNKLCVLSMSAVGEIFTTLLLNEINLNSDSQQLTFNAITELVESCDLVFVKLDDETIIAQRKIREEDGERMQDLDLINFASAVRFHAVAFVTLDNRISEITGQKYGTKIINLRKLKA